MDTDLDCAVRKLKILVALAGSVKSRIGPSAEALAHAAAGMIGCEPRRSSSIHVGLTADFMLTTRVVLSGVDMLVMVLGK